MLSSHPVDQRLHENEQAIKSFYFDNRSDELLQECVFEQGGPVVVEKVDEQTFDMGSILILEQEKHFSIQETDYFWLLHNNYSYQSCESVFMLPDQS